MADVVYFLLLTSLLVYVTAADNVVIGILAGSVSIECNLPLSDTLVWEDSDGSIIAIHGVVTGSVSRKYVIEKQNGVREILVIHELTLADAKKYRCYDLRNKTDTEVFILNVLVQPHVMQIAQPHEPAQEGTEVTLVCEADGGKPLPEVTWYKTDSTGASTEITGLVEDIMYVNTTGYRRHMITVNVTRETYMTSYICNISVSVFYHRSLKAELDVKLKPQTPVISGYHGGYDVGKVMTLECTSTGSKPAATIFWLQDNVRVGNYEFVVIPEGNGTFTVKSFFKRTLTRDFNASVLTCAANNVVLEKLGLPPMMTDLTLLATYKPVITVPVTNHTSSEGDDVTLECLISALPAPDPSTLVWSHSGDTINRDNYVMPNGSRGFGLRLTNISRSDAGDYRCTAANRLGVTSGEPVHLTVLFSPICTTNGIVKHAARIGDNVRLHCRMHALPSNVTLLWQYEDSDHVIDSVPAVKDANAGDIAYGTLDLHVNAHTEYSKLACYGLNSEGKGQPPCEYEIVPPNAPDPPSNCYVISAGSNISVTCEPGFNGGSSQHFMLQHLIDAEYQTLKNSTDPTFTFLTSMNVTLRICAVNREFDYLASCGSPVVAIVHDTAIPISMPISTSKGNTSAYIAGGITAFVGIIVITTLVIVLIRRQKKQCRAPEIPISIQDIQNAQEHDKHSKAKAWTKSILQNIRSLGNHRNKPRRPLETVRRCEVVMSNIDDSDDDGAYQRVEVLASTPYITLKQQRIRSSTFEMGIIAAVPSKQILRAEQNIVNSSPGFTLSPISLHSENSSTFLNGALDNETSRNDHTDGDVGLPYCTADMMDILSDTKELEIAGRLEFTAEQEETGDDGMVTRNKDYSAGDILEVLNGSENSANNTHAIWDTHHPASLNEVTADSVHSWKGHTATNMSKVNFLENDSHDNIPNCTLHYAEPCDSLNVKQSLHDDNEFQTRRVLRKVYSLPNKSRKQKHKSLAKMMSVPDMTTSHENITTLPPLTRGVYNDSLRNCLVRSPAHGVACDSVCVPCVRDYRMIGNVTANTNANSELTDAYDTICGNADDTLTSISDASTHRHVADGAVYEATDEMNGKDIRVDDIDVIRNDLNDLPGPIRVHLSQPCLRRNSFLSAMNNNHTEIASDGSGRGDLVAGDSESESEHTYANEGFQMEDMDATNTSQDNTHDNDTQAPINVVAYF